MRGSIRGRRAVVDAETGEVRVEECEVELPAQVQDIELPPPVDLEKLVQALVKAGVIKSREEVEVCPAESTPGQ